MKIGILGGAFDPIHKGHVHMAKCALKEYELDRVIFVPSGHSPNKEEKNMTSFVHRYNMCRLATEDIPEFEVSDIEIRDTDISYTYMTLLHFKKIYPSEELFFIMGGDSLDYFDCWKKPETIAGCAVILVVVRQDFPAEQMKQKIARIKDLFWADIRLLKCDRMDVSSTQVRSDICADRDVSGLLDEQVIEYIKSNNLYR